MDNLSSERILEKIVFTARIALGKYLLDPKVDIAKPIDEVIEIYTRGFLLGDELGLICFEELDVPNWLYKFLYKIFGGKIRKYEAKSFFPNYKPSLPNQDYKYIVIGGGQEE